MSGCKLRVAAGVYLALASATHPASGQLVGLEVAAGLGTPTGSFGASRGTGPLVQVAAVQTNAERRLRLRGQFEVAWMPGSDPSSPLGRWRTGDVRVLTGLLGLIAGPRGSSAAPYAVLAIGAHSMAIEAVRNPYNTVLGARIGAGFRWRARGVQARVELTPHAILSDFGSAEYSPGVFWATTAGLTFQPRVPSGAEQKSKQPNKR